MISVKEAIIVEGRYDKIKLSGIVDAPIIETNGFRVFSDKGKAVAYPPNRQKARDTCADRQRRRGLCYTQLP